MKLAVGKRAVSPGNALIFAVLLGGMIGVRAQAQDSPVEPPPQSASERPVVVVNPLQQASSSEARADHLPDAPGQSTGDERSDASIYGTVTDPNGNVIAGAHVTLEIPASKAQQVQVTDSTGYFRFSGLGAGTFRVSISAKGFSDWEAAEIVLTPGRYYQLPEVVLRVAPANTNIEVVFTHRDLAEEQIKLQEQQRILGVVPNFYTSYVWHAASLTSGQKFRLALRTSIDPVTFGIAAATAGIEQSQNSFSGYGQGGEGYAKRFAASYADDVVDTLIGSAILPSILHQDPRYFYKGTGSIPSRALYAISTVVICRGDDGQWEPNYSNVAGNLISAGISNLYYPSSNRHGAEETIENALINTAEGAAGALLQEFLLKKISRGVQHQPPGTQPIPESPR
jgi:Carboxypeptidase regulatory-like domain